MNSVVAELEKVTGKERILLEQCKDFLSTLAAMQVSNTRMLHRKDFLFLYLGFH